MSSAIVTGIGPLTHEKPVRRKRLRVLVWVVGIIVIGGMLIAVMLPSLCRAREPANRVKCASNLRQIGQAITFYAQEHGGQYPPSLAGVLATQDITAEVMTCPSSNDERATGAAMADVVAELSAAETNAPGHKHCLSYVYAGGGLNAKTVPATTVVAYEALDNHDGDGTNVLFGDGHVDWVDKKTWPTMAPSASAALAASPATRP